MSDGWLCIVVVGDVVFVWFVIVFGDDGLVVDARFVDVVGWVIYVDALVGCFIVAFAACMLIEVFVVFDGVGVLCEILVDVLV